MEERFLTYRELMSRLGVGKSSIYRRISDGTLPRPIKIGHLSRFRESEVTDALAKLAPSP
ncbi:MAG: hypothetical protein CML55_10205 [Rhodobacteraceae bacterium]|nr:hypothetical protein [Paracoccaceae bacterium]